MTQSQSDIEAAIDWLVRLQGDEVTEADWHAFDAWLNLSPANGEAYDAALVLDQRLDLEARLADAERSSVADVVSLSRPRRADRRVWIWSAGAALAAAFVAGVVLLPPGGSTGHETIYTTKVGERRTVALEDGSRIEMNAGSRLSVRYDRLGRHVRMDDAQAFFDVAKDPNRPFLIEAGETQVRVVGTQFDVRRRDGQVAVSVSRGLVEVRPNASQAAAPLRLRPGQGVSHREGRAGDTRVAAVGLDEVAGWRQGRLIYRDQPLSEIVSDLNRLFPRPVKLGDSQVADMRLSGVLIVDGQDAMVDRLSHLLPVRTTTTNDAIVIRAR